MFRMFGILDFGDMQGFTAHTSQPTPPVYTCPTVLFNKTVHGVPFNGKEQKRLFDWYVGTPTPWYKLGGKSLVLPV